MPRRYAYRANAARETWAYPLRSRLMVVVELRACEHRSRKRTLFHKIFTQRKGYVQQANDEKPGNQQKRYAH
jgi:hypothetical protein